MPKAKCGCEVRWIEMQSGKMMPVEEKQVGVVVVDATKKGKLLFGYTPHWQNCPKAKLFKHGVGDPDEGDNG